MNDFDDAMTLTPLHDCEITIAEAQALDGSVDRDERRGARRVDRQRWTLRSKKCEIRPRRHRKPQRQPDRQVT